ncbi:Pancreatic trypsin inhibitor Kunitz domain,Proteinase inhibitor I2, Kunitz, conserved site [Cinara cedri]|uniref:Pancreatic trypsin inhibitor Kunitz domain,Proteinase inhibitor I2, Kunitz, conserved site n=1 Tax=Cinara cedri TaxID=506608 RepID=A0A5E4N007_9HEMI|nr:Pancreatic trypsin inhibitor Kunitz domain,Proteinase inhibitor I2, Kunitz, conserved site [Cinara cedri]
MFIFGMNPKTRNNGYRVIACTVVLGYLVCSLPVTTQTPVRGVCFLPPDEGNCLNRLSMRVKFYFNYELDECSEFIFFGCGGNENRFDTFDECENVCLYNYYN